MIARFSNWKNKRKSSTRITFRSYLWPALTVLAIFLQLITPSRIWMSLVIIMGGGWLIATLWARSLLYNLRASRELRYGWAQVGDRLEERFSLVNQGWAPAPWVEIRDQSTLPDYPASRIASIGYLTSERWLIESTCTRRGLYTLGPTTLRTADPLGIYTIYHYLPQSAVLMVMPPIIPLPNIQIAPAGRAGEGRQSRLDTLERTVSTTSARPFQPGDHPKWIHWPISARHDDLYVRVFNSTPTSDWLILLDLDKYVQVGEGWDSTVEHGIILAASLADHGLRMGNSVGLATHGEKLVWLPPQKTPVQRMDILRSLAIVNTGIHPLSELLSLTRNSILRGASLVIITPAFEGAWLESLLPLLKTGISPTVILFEPASFGGSGSLVRVTRILTNYGIFHHIITRELLDTPEAHPGQQGGWEWRFLKDGRFIPLHRPKDLRWRRLA